ncbi:MAG: RNA repair domain-containing protein [Candidatus Bathyarchaeia archaeon]
MSYISLQSLLNKLVWDKRFNIKNYSLTFIHRGAKDGKKIIPCQLITKIGKSWFTYNLTLSEQGTRKVNAVEREAFIPFHRILEIKNIKTGEILWKRRTQ